MTFIFKYNNLINKKHIEIDQQICRMIDQIDTQVAWLTFMDAGT